MVTYFDNQSSLRVGSMFHKRFYIEKVLSDTGGFGITYLVRDQEMFNGARVLKQLRMSGVQNAKAVELFEREARTLSQLSHPNIPRLHAFFHDINSYYLVEDFVEGKSLRQILQQQGPCASSFVFEILNQMLDVLHYIHSQSMVHRDIKPDNLVWSFEGKVHLIDFGAVNEAIRSNKTEATVIFTQGYAAPEQIKGHVYPESDIYALGVTLIELLTEKNPVDLYDPHQQKWIWEKFAEDVDPHLAAVLNKMTQEQMSQRFHTAQDIRQYINGADPIPASPPVNTSFQTASVVRSPAAVVSQREQITLKGPAGLVTALQWHGARILGVISQDNNTLKMWRMPEGRELANMALRFKPLGFSWSPEPQRLAISGSQGELLWLKMGDPSSPTVRLAEASPLVKWSSDGIYLATVRQDAITIYDTRTGQQQYQFQERSKGKIVALEWRPDSQFLSLGTDKGELSLWEVFTEQQTAHWYGHQAPICLLQWDPSGQTLCTVATNGHVCIWPAYAQQPQTELQLTNRVEAAHWNAHDALLTCVPTGGQGIQWWHIPSKTHRETLTPDQEIRLLSWSPDGKYLAAVGKGPALMLWKNA